MPYLTGTSADSYVTKIIASSNAQFRLRVPWLVLAFKPKTSWWTNVDTEKQAHYLYHMCFNVFESENWIELLSEVISNLLAVVIVALVVPHSKLDIFTERNPDQIRTPDLLLSI